MVPRDESNYRHENFQFSDPPPPYTLGCDDCDNEAGPQLVLLLIQCAISMEFMDYLEVVQVLNNP